MNQLLKTAIQAAIEAGEEILKIYQSEDFGVETKADNSPLTKADQAAHNCICSYLKETQFPILSEEGKHIEYSVRARWKTFWLVDPLDGTKEFIKRNGEFTVNIALIEKNTPVLGVVFVPVLNEIYYADENGAFKAKVVKHEIEIPSIQQLTPKIDLKPFTVVVSRSHMSNETEEYIASLDRKGLPLQVISKGSSLKICLVAEGLAHCYPRLGPTMEWDTAAGHAIAKYAGKTVRQYPENTALLYNKENLLNPYFVVK